MTTFAQEKEAEQEQLWYCWEATVHPTKIDQFKAFSIEELALFKEMNYPLPFYAWTDHEFHFYYYIPMNSYEDVFKLQEALNLVYKKMGDEKTNKFWEAIEYHEDYFIRYLPDISFTPKEPRLHEDDLMFSYLDTKYVVPGREKEIIALFKELMEHAENVGCYDAIHSYMGDLGNNGSTITTILQAKSAADFYHHNEKAWELLDEKGIKIFQQILKLTLKREHIQIWYLEDLSYIPVKEEIEE